LGSIISYLIAKPAFDLVAAILGQKHGSHQRHRFERQNVRYWLKADIPAHVVLCPLSGVKRTFKLSTSLL
jgi:hypothetical protein